MSHHLHNPFGSGNQRSTQGRYGLGEMDPHSESSRFGPRLGSSGTVAYDTSGGAIPLAGQSVGRQPEPRRTSVDDDLERSVDLYISRAREKVGFGGEPDHQPAGQRTHFLGSADYQSSRVHASSYPQSSSSASQSHQYVESKKSSIDWLPKYKGPAEDKPSMSYSTPPSSGYTHISDGTFSSSAEGQRDVESFTRRDSEKVQPMYTSQSAVDILLRFGLEKEDLEYLISYPEDQLTPSNLPYILRQIRMQKERNSTAVVESKPYTDVQPSRGSEMSFAGPQVCRSKAPQVIDYGHTGKYLGGTSRTESIDGDGSVLKSYEQRVSSGSQGQVHKDSTEVKVSALVSPWSLGGSDARLNSPYQSTAPSISDSNKPGSTTAPSSLVAPAAPTSNKPSQHFFNQPSQASPVASKSFNLPHKDPNRQVLSSEPNFLALTDPDAGTKPKPPTPKRKGLVLVDKTYSRGTVGDSTSQGSGAPVTKPIKKEQNEDVKKVEEQKQKPDKKNESEKMQKKPAEAPKQPQPHMDALWSAYSPLQPLKYPVPYFKPDASSVADPTTSSSSSSSNQASQPKTVNKLPGIQIQPSLAMMHDYAATTPKVFPHICSLCFKECETMKSWLSHQNTSLHLQSCIQLRTIYPRWNGEVPVQASPLNKDTKSSSTTSAKTSQKQHGSRSHSHSTSPNRRRGSTPKKPKRSRSRSRSSRYSRSSSDSPQRSSYRSRSRSQERERRRRRRRSRTRSSEDSQPSPKRSRERRSLSRRREDRRYSPERRSHRRLPLRRSRERRSPPRRIVVRRSPVGRDDRKLPARRSDERRGLREKSPEQQESSSAKRLVQKLLQKAGGQSQCEADLEAVVKTLLKEITKTKAPTAAETGSKQTKGSSSVSHRNPDVASSSTSLPSVSISTGAAAAKKTPTTTKTSLMKPRMDKLSPVSAPTMVRLEGITAALSRNDVISALECFGRIKSIILSRKKEQALVCFEKEEDAKKVKSVKGMEVKGVSVTVMRKKDPVVKKTPLKKTTTSNDSTLHKKRLTVRTVTPLTKGLKKPLAPQVTWSPPGTGVSSPVKSARKGSVKGKGSPGVSRAKVLVSKAKHVSKHSQKVVWETKGVSQNDQNDVDAPITLPVAEPDHILDDSGGNRAAPTESPILVENSAEPTNVSTTMAVDALEAVNSEVQQPVEVPETVVLEQPSLQETQEDKPGQIEPEVKEKAEDRERAEETVPVLSDEKMDTVSRPPEEKQNLSNTESVQEEPPTETRTDLLKPEESESCPPQETDAPPEPQTDAGPTPEPELETKNDLPSISADVLEKKDSLPAVENQEGPMVVPLVSKADDSVKAAAAAAAAAVPSVTVQKPLIDPTPSFLTVVDMDRATFDQKDFSTYTVKHVASPEFLNTNNTVVMIKNLPNHHDVWYTEDDLARILEFFGFIYKDENIFVMPRACVAFCVLPSTAAVQKLISRRIYFKGHKLLLSVPSIGFNVSPYLLYKFVLKRLTGRSSEQTGTIYVKNISPVQTKQMLNFVVKMMKVAVAMPFLNKVFVEFHKPRHADLLGVWFSLVNPAPSFTMYRLLIPQKGKNILQAKSTPNDLIKSFTDGMTFKAAQNHPKGCSAPFWLSVHTRPYVFPTRDIWFQIPRTITHQSKREATVAYTKSTRPVILLTGLPEGRYKHEDVARLFWSWFPKQSLRALYYNVLVLVLQRRAFIHFHDWTSCFKFFNQHDNNKPLTLCGSALKMHFVTDNMSTQISEELMFIQLLTLSNSRVPNWKSLEERLVCVEIAEATVNIVTVVMEAIASIADFVRFLPLANRICVEMVHASGVKKVVEMGNKYEPKSKIRLNTWKKVLRFESAKSLNQRMRETGHNAIDLYSTASTTAGAGSTSAHATSSAVGVSPKEAKKPWCTEKAGPGVTLQPLKVVDIKTDSKEVDRDDQFSFNIDDFVTVDEVWEDVGDVSAYQHGVKSSKQKDEGEATSRSPVPDGKRKRSPSPRSSSASPKKSRLSTKSSSSPPPSPQPSSSHAQSDPTPSSVVPSVETNASTSVQSEDRVEPLLKVCPPVQGQESEKSQEQNHDLEERKEEEEEEEEEERNYQVLDSFEEQMENEGNEEQQSRNSDNPFPEPGEIFHVLDSVGDNYAEFCTEATEEASKCLAEDPEPSGETVDDKPVGGTNQPEAKKDLSSEIDVKVKNSEENEEKEKIIHLKSSDQTEKPDGPMAEVIDQPQSETPPPKEGPSLMVDPKSQKETEEEVLYQVVDSTEEQSDVNPMDPDNRTSGSDVEINTRSSSQKTRTTEDAESKTEELTEDMEFEVLDSVGEEPTVPTSTLGRSAGRRSSRGRKEVGDDVVTVKTRSSSRKRDVFTRSDVSTVGPNKEETPSRRTHNAARKTLKVQQEVPEESRSTNKEEATFEILDSIDDKDDDRPSRGRKGKLEKPNRREEQAAKKTELMVKEEDTYEILDSLDARKEEPPVTKRKRGRPKKEVRRKTGEPQVEEHMKCEQVADGRDGSNQMIHSLEDPVEDGHSHVEQSQSSRKTRASKKDKVPAEERTPRTRSRKSKSMEEPQYQILDSLEDTQEEVSKDPGEDSSDHQPEDRDTEAGTETREHEDQTRRSDHTGERDILEDHQEKQPLTPGVSKDTPGEAEVVVKVLDDGGDLSTNALVNLDEVSDEEEDFPDDVEEEEEESRKRHTRRLSKNSECSSREKESDVKGTRDSASVREDQPMCDDRKSVKDLEEVSDTSSVVEDTSETPGETTTPSMEEDKESSQKNDSLVNLDQVSDEEEDFPDDTAVEEELRKKQAAVKDRRPAEQQEGEQGACTTRERRSQSSRGGGGGGDGSGDGEGRMKEVDIKELVTLDEVGDEDEAGDDMTAQSQESEAEELQGLVTLDELHEDDDGNDGQAGGKPSPGVEEGSSSMKEVKTLVCAEADHDGDDQTNKPVRSKEEAEEDVDFVTVDEVGEFGEEENDPTSRSQGRQKRKSWTTAVRKSTRGKRSAEREGGPGEQEPGPHLLLNNPRNPKDADRESENIQELQGPDEALIRPTAALLGPGVKRSRSESPSCSVNTNLPPFHPNRSVGQEFVVPTLGFFCKLCSTFYVKEKAITQDPHCSSREHYDRLREHFQKMEERSRPSRRSGRKTQGYISD